jgi:hypothetical protein
VRACARCLLRAVLVVGGSGGESQAAAEEEESGWREKGGIECPRRRRWGVSERIQCPPPRMSCSAAQCCMYAHPLY